MIVVDNGSTDGSGELARAAGALVVEEPRRGYGSAYLAGLAVAPGRLHRHARCRPDVRLPRDPAFVRELEDGAQLVVGNRMSRHRARRDAVGQPTR